MYDIFKICTHAQSDRLQMFSWPCPNSQCHATPAVQALLAFLHTLLSGWKFERWCRTCILVHSTFFHQVQSSAPETQSCKFVRCSFLWSIFIVPCDRNVDGALRLSCQSFYAPVTAGVACHFFLEGTVGWVCLRKKLYCCNPSHVSYSSPFVFIIRCTQNLSPENIFTVFGIFENMKFSLVSYDM